MKKRILSLLLILMLGITALVSCSGDGGEQNTPPAPGNGELIYGNEAVVRIIKTDAGIDLDINGLTNKLIGLTGRMPNSFLDGSEASSNEIVLGPTSRDITAYANEYIDGLELVSNDTAVWCIYAYNGSVAITWSHEIDELAEGALAYFIDNYVTESSLYLKDGPVHYETFDRRAYEDAREAAIREEQLDAIETKLGKEARDAIADYLKIFRDEYYVWLANLYDPGTGGFYYSNSGRDTEGFLPDIESTVQALNWIASTGMLEKYDNKLINGLPEWMQEQVLAYAMSLQSPIDGYFYHPQWGASISTSRLSRDLMWATQIIKNLGGQVLYDAPNGDKGSLGAPPGEYPAETALTERLGASAAAAVSKVVSTSTTHLPSHLQSPEAFRKYLLDFNWETNSYSAGNTVTSQNGQILNAGPEFVAVFEEVLNEKQEEMQERLRDAAEAALLEENPKATAEEIAAARKAAENGLWEEGVYFNSINGLMKISSAYNGLGVKLPYAEACIRSAMKMVYEKGADSKNKSPTNSVDVYNPWVSLQAIINNVNKFYSKAEANALRAIVTENAAAMIKVTMEKVLIFAKDDGSFGYMQKGVPAKSQGASVAVEGTNEGDINGGGIATNGTFGSMCGALGISKPNLYFNSDYEVFIEIIEGLSPVEKVPIQLEKDPVTFDEDEVDSEAPSRINASMNGGYVKVIPDTREGATGNVLEFSTVTGVGQTMTTGLIGSGIGNCFVLEWDMNIKENRKNTVIFQIRLGEAYMFTVTTRADGYVIGDSSSVDGKVSVTNTFDGIYNYDTWYTFRVEHYTGDIDTVKTIIYVNGEQIAVSDNFFGKVREGYTPVVAPKSDFTNGRFYALNSADIVAHFDNITVERISKALELPEGGESQKPEVAPYAGVLDFEGSTAKPDQIRYSINGEAGSDIKIVADPTLAAGEKANNVLQFNATGAPVGGGGNAINVVAASESESANCYVAGADFYFESVANNSVPFQFFFLYGGENIYCVNFAMVYKDDGTLTLRIYEKPEGDTSKETIVPWFEISGWINIRIEYYKDRKTAKFYINDVCVAENGTYWNDANATADFTNFRFFSLRATDCEIYVDNITAKKIVKEYTPEAK